MPLPLFKRIYTNVFEIQKLQDHMAESLSRLLAQPDVPKLLLENVALNEVTATDVPHGLGRSITRYLVCRRSAAAEVYDQQDDNPTPAQTLRLLSSQPVRVDLLVF
jgi:hypothetical protein